ncbi:SpoIIE family protein phosphatase [Streptomyces sp. SID8382]|uniref:ATP-binding SpoIIE family protein phosphatase n=1 Tax=Streptomyces malaysiensis TaxID=92644 RepID=UPI000C2C80C1|nr:MULTISPECIES: SpoIIE family protein phosphatase [unclassified Streptomyces]AUA15983.1 Phosphoserine phosphatase RsbU [Streptomyces sp. M56]MYX56785.1 SpoIIE family protein phosphatase [Streptomyces sp. SID8382]
MGVDEQHPHSAGTRITRSARTRLRLLGSAGGQLSGTGPLRLALGQAVAGSGALGGMIHVRDPRRGEMRLVASMGLPDHLIAGWEVLTEEDSAAPVSCLRYRTHVWSPPPPDVPHRAPPPSSGRSSSEDFSPRAGTLPPGSGVASVPVLTADGQPVGALSVLMEAQGEIGGAERAFLRMVADWAADYLRPVSPAATDTGQAGEPLGGEAVGSAVWRMNDGLLALDHQARLTFANAAALKLLGASAQEALGTVLWDHPVIRDTGMAACHGRALANRAPAGFDTRWPGRAGWYHARLDPVPDGLVIHITDITERRAQEAERSAAQRTAAERVMRMGELTSALAEALTVQDVVKAVADRMLPPFGATGLICQLIENGRLRMVGSAGYPEEFLATVQTFMVSDMSAIVQVLSSRTPHFLSTPREYAEQHPDALGYLYRSGMNAWAFLPLIASDQQIGYCVVSFARPRHFSEEDRSLLIALSGLVAQALERARLYDAEHTRAQELQRGLLPRTLPAVPAVAAEARYLPATEGVQVGGDWYDLIPLSGERVALVIGDVMGHGLSEAATMGRLRTAVHTLADLELPPDELLSHLNELVGDLGDDFYATCLYTVYDPVTNRCAFASAGHPPLAIVHPDGTAHFPHVDADPPLGAASPPFETHEVRVPEGSHLVLYTDGLVESSTVDIDEGMDRLAQALSRVVAPPPEPPGAEAAPTTLHDPGRLCDALISALVPEQAATHDDAALLIARTRSLAPGRVVCWALPDGPIAAAEARRRVTGQLSAWHLDELSMTTELLVSELVGNVVRHAKGPPRLRLLYGRTLICEVSDGSLTTPRIRRAAETDEGGRGLQLVAALSDRWGMRYTATGKCIWTEQALPAPSRPAVT